MMYRDQPENRMQLLQKINEVSFAVDDILLYLDTHPCCEDLWLITGNSRRKERN